MTILALLVIALIWVAVLVPPLVRSRAELRSTASIGRFRRQLGVLMRAGPKIVAPAYRLDDVTPSSAGTVRVAEEIDIRPALTARKPSAAVVLSHDRETPAAGVTLPPGGVPALPGPAQTRASLSYSDPRNVERRSTLQRRRDVLMVLASALAGSLVLGAIPGLRLLWAVAVLAAAALAGYVWLLLRLKRRRLERQAKLAYLPQRGRAVQREGEPHGYGELRRSVN